MNKPMARAAAGLVPAKHADRKVVMVTSPGNEASMAEVVINLATVSAEVGQRVVIVTTEGLEAPTDGSDLPLTTPSRWRDLTSTGEGVQDGRAHLDTGALDPADVEELLGDTGIRNVSRLDIRYFVSHPAQVVIRAPEVFAALEKIRDVVILEVPSILSVHYGEGLAPLVDAVLVIGERRTTKLSDLRKAGAMLTRLGAPVVGMAVTRPGQREGTDPWGSSDLEWTDEEARVEHDDTARLPILNRSAVRRGARHDPGAIADLASPEA
jgi:hypothetical protein